MTQIHSVLFLCTANICRSPMAMGLMRLKVSAHPATWKVESAGTWAYDGAPAAENTIKVLRKYGVDLSDHRSRQVTDKMLQEFNLILVMERGHKEGLRIEFPQFKNRIFLLSEMIDQSFDIDDPMGSGPKEFEDTSKLIEQILENGFEKIMDLSIANSES